MSHSTGIETNGVEQIPDDQRDASPLDLFRLIFGGANTFATAVLGSFPVLFGLSFQAGVWAILLGVGVGMPGPVDGEEGVYRGTSDPDPWRGAPIRRLLAEELGMPVLLDHDSRAALVGEAWSQPGLLRNAALLLVEDGLGAALCLDDQIVRGAHSHAGEIGHTVVRMDGIPCPCGRRGCAQREHRAALERGEDELAARILAEVVVNLVRLVDVDRVVLGGRTVHEQHEASMDAIREALTAGLSDEPWVHVEVMLSTRGMDLIAVGAACEVLEHEYGLPQVLVGPE